MRLTALSTLRKLSGDADFTLEACFGKALDDARAPVASAWLQAHIMAENEQLLALTRSSEDIWLVRGVREAGTDNSGRQLHRLWFGLLAPGLADTDPVAAARTLFGCYQNRLPPLPADAEANDLPQAKTEPRFDESAMHAAAVLLVTEEPIATVSGVEPALAVIELIGLWAFDHLVMSRRGVPRLLPPGKALIISGSDVVSVRPLSSGLMTQIQALRPFDLRRLASASASPMRRMQLVRAATDPDFAVPNDLGSEELYWLLAIPQCRRRALRAASDSQLVRLVDDAALSVEELEEVSCRLTPASQIAVARQLAREPSGLDLFVAWFGRGADGIEEVLLPDVAAAWTHLEDAAAARPFTQVFERAGLLDRLIGDLPRCARLVRAWAGALDDVILLRLLAQAGCSAPAALLALLTDSPPPPDPTALAGDLPSLIRIGVIERGTIVNAVLRDWPTALLATCDFGRESIGLVTDWGLPQRAEPADWDETLRPLLRRAVGETWFWRRWPDGVPSALVDWLHAVLDPAPEATVIASLLAARTGTRPLTPAELALLAPAVGLEAVARQVVLWAGNDRDGRDDSLNHLLAVPCLTDELRGWLRGELTSARPSPSPPELPAALMTALLPLLHPQRDVIRRVLARPQVEPGEDELLAELVSLLSRTGFGVPLPQPDTADRLRRPDWITALSRLSGWEHWRLPEQDVSL